MALFQGISRHLYRGPKKKWLDVHSGRFTSTYRCPRAHWIDDWWRGGDVNIVVKRKIPDPVANLIQSEASGFMELS